MAAFENTEKAEAEAVKRQSNKRSFDSINGYKNDIPRKPPEPNNINGVVILTIWEWIKSRQKPFVLTSHIKNLPSYKAKYQQLFKKHGGIKKYVEKYGGNLLSNGVNKKEKPIIQCI